MGQCLASKASGGGGGDSGHAASRDPEAALGAWSPLIIKAGRHKGDALVLGENIPNAGSSAVTADGKFVTVGSRDAAIWWRINGGHGHVPKYMLQTMGEATLTLHVDEYKAGGALYMTSKPALGDTSYFRFNTAPGDGTISPDGFPQLVLGVATMGEKGNGAEEASLDAEPGTNFERMLREQAPEEFAERQEKIKRQKTPRAGLRRAESVRQVLEHKRAGLVSLCLVPKDDAAKLQFLMCAGGCALETQDLTAAWRSMCHRSQRTYVEIENRAIADAEMHELARFRVEKEQFGADYLEGSKNKERLARMHHLEAKYPNSEDLREQRDAALNRVLARSASLKRATSVRAAALPEDAGAGAQSLASPARRPPHKKTSPPAANDTRPAAPGHSPEGGSTAIFRHVTLEQTVATTPKS